MVKSTFNNDMEARVFPKLNLPKGMTSPGKFGNGTVRSGRKSTDEVMTKNNRFHPTDTGNLK
tara:strand:+ start:3539 stop:3724 length:186 start_codon:yes stop_codon:yes gene_type:complete